ncbi:hypothetical protein [Sphingobacterium sp. WOUb80]|uniref:hypothetical protein n=1 Tax=Sphingobacterium sp. WOUb80 TaxID=3234028 RepID=UPI003CE9576B
MRTLNIYIIFLTVLFTNCATLRDRAEELKVHKRMEELKTFEEYVTADTEIKKKNVLAAEITFIDGRDLKTKIKAVKGVINNSLDERSINKSVAIYDYQGKEDYLSYTLIRQLTFTDYEGKKRIFVNKGDQFDSLLEIMYAGRIKWFREFYESPYNSFRNYYDIFVKESGEEINDKVAIKLKNKLIKATAEKPVLKEKIEQTNKLDDQTVIALLKEFEQ